MMKLQQQTLTSLETYTDESFAETRNEFEESKQSPFWSHVDFKVACYKLGEETVHTIAHQSIVGSITLSSLLWKGF